MLVTSCAILGCASGKEITSVSQQLDRLDVQLLELRKDSATGGQIADVSRAVDQAVTSLSSGQAGLSTEIQNLREQVEQLSAKLDDTHFRLTQLLQQLSAAHQELQALRAAGSASERPSSNASPARPTAARPGDPQSLYDAAYADYTHGNLDLAAVGFRQYLEEHPNTALTDNALYWLGECYYRQGKFARALEQFDQILARFAGGDQVASALLKKGYAYLEMGQRAQGIVQLQKVVCEHPGTDQAALARQRLAELGIDVTC